MIVVSFANDTWRFRLGWCSVWIFTTRCPVAPFRLWLLFLLLFLLLPLLLLLSYLIFGLTSFIKRRGRRRGRIGWSRRLGVILVSSSCWLDCSGIMEFRTTEVEKSHIGKPIVNPGSDNVAIWGAPTSLQEEKGLGFPKGEILGWWTPFFST